MIVDVGDLFRPSREIAVYRVTVPSNAPSWKLRVANTVGDSSLAVGKDRLPNIVAGPSGNVTNATVPPGAGKRQEK